MLSERLCDRGLILFIFFIALIFGGCTNDTTKEGNIEPALPLTQPEADYGTYDTARVAVMDKDCFEITSLVSGDYVTHIEGDSVFVLRRQSDASFTDIRPQKKQCRVCYVGKEQS